jgi:hypothetical protein
MLKHYLQKPDASYLLWWTIGIACYGAGTLVESLNTIYGWSEFKFKAWYITGALLGGWPLATGTVFLIFRNKTAKLMTVIGFIIIISASVLTMLSPIHYNLIDGNRLTGNVLQWKFIRYITPFINIYAFVFLVGGAVFSAVQYSKSIKYKSRFWGNLFIAIGGLLPGIGGTYSKMGLTEVLYVTEFAGLIFIFWGYMIMRKDKAPSIHNNQKLNLA